jgi:hypothetical protein
MVPSLMPGSAFVSTVTLCGPLPDTFLLADFDAVHAPVLTLVLALVLLPVLAAVVPPVLLLLLEPLPVVPPFPDPLTLLARPPRFASLLPSLPPDEVVATDALLDAPRP